MTWGPGNLWVLDDVASKRFPIYCRGNAAEVNPHVSSPMTRSIATSEEDPEAAAFLEWGLVTERDLREGGALLTGNFGGYGYTNLSLARVAAVRTPLMSPTDFDAQMYGSNLGPPYVRSKGDRDLRATLRILWQSRRMLNPDLGFVETDRAEVDAWVASLPDPASQTDGQLFALVRTGPDRFGTTLFSSLAFATTAALGGSTSVERFAGMAKAADGTPSRLVSGVGSIESAEPAVLLWELGRLVASDPLLVAEFDAGSDGLLGRLGRRAGEGDGDGAANVREFLRGFEDFLRRHGHRGPDEWELERDTWGTRPEIALEAIDRLRRAPAANDPAGAQKRLAADSQTALAEIVGTRRGRVLGPLLRWAIRNATAGSAARERTKSTAVLARYPIRLAMFELARRAVALSGPAHDRRDVFLLTLDELERYFGDPAAFAEIVAERRARRDYLEEREPPFWFEGTIPDPSTWALRGGGADPVDEGEVLTGVVVSTGRATGRARVITDPADPRGLEPGDVLVAPFTDPAWTPLFLAANAVVVDVGAVQSHAAIVARELGIPAVVSVEHATRRIPDGAELEVDADAGTVTILALPT